MVLALDLGVFTRDGHGLAVDILVWDGVSLGSDALTRSGRGICGYQALLFSIFNNVKLGE